MRSSANSLSALISGYPSTLSILGIIYAFFFLFPPFLPSFLSSFSLCLQLSPYLFFLLFPIILGKLCYHIAFSFLVVVFFFFFNLFLTRG